MRTSPVPVYNYLGRFGFATVSRMRLSQILEELETEFDALAAPAETGLKGIGSIDVALGDRVITLRNLVFAANFVLGVNGRTVYALPHSHLIISRSEPGTAVTSKQSFKSWLGSLEGLWLTTHAQGQSKRSRLLAVERGMMCLRSGLVPISAVQWLSVEAVDNSQLAEPKS